MMGYKMVIQNETKYKNKKKKRNSFKLGDDTATSFSGYKKNYKVHKPKIKKGSNQFLVTQKMRKLQELSMHNNQDSMTMNEINESFGKPLDELNTIKLPNYSGEIPLILIELKKKLYLCDGLKQRKIFHVEVKNNTSTHHRIAHLIHDFLSIYRLNY